MKKHFILFLISFFVIPNGFCQDIENQKKILEDAYTNYFNIEREAVHLHINKNTFLTNETVWFKGYVFDKKNNIPFKNTTNVYVALYNSDGREVKSKLFFAQQGIFSGSIDIENNLVSGSYYLRAYTNWMNNFKEDESYTSKPITILDNKQLENASENLISIDFDLQFLPEGGHSLSNANNSIGLKIIDCNGNGIEIEGNITDSKNQEVANFKSNTFGLGKFDLFMQKNETYTANYNINNNKLTKILPKSEDVGFAISINNYTNKNTTYVSLKTNTLTLEKEANKNYYLVINQNDKSSVVEINTNNLKTENTIPIPTKNLISGVNTITIFNNELEPIIERLIFNYNGIHFIESNIIINKALQDSLPVTIHTKTKNGLATATNLSVSILPKSTIANQKNEDIISAFLISPYINGTIQNPNYYFNKIDRLKQYNLDLLLLTQGWSKYIWKNIKQGKPKLNYPFDVGLTVKGTVNKKISNSDKYSVQMFSLANNINEFASLDDNNNFYFKNFYLKDSIALNFSVLKDGNTENDTKPYVQILDNNKSFINTINFKPLCNNFEISKSLSDRTNLNNEQALDTVQLAYKYKTWDDALERKDEYIGNKFSKGIKIDSIMRRSYRTVLDLIHSRGFHTYTDLKTGVVYIKNRTPKSILANDDPKLIIDDADLGNNYDILIGLSLDEVDEIYINKSGMGYGASGGGGIIRIYRTKAKRQGGSYKDQNAREVIVENGFASEKEFYIPKFYNQSKSNFIKYGALSWEPNLTTDTNGNASFKFLNTNINNFVVIIQGMTNDGKLLSEIKEITIN